MILNSNKKYFLILTIFLVTMLVGITMVSAANVNSTNTSVSDSNSHVLTKSVNTIKENTLSSNNSNNTQKNNYNIINTKTIKNNQGITSWDELKSSIETGGTYNLSNDIKANSTLTTTSKTNAIINGNGHTITFTQDGQINVKNDSTLTIANITLDGNNTVRTDYGIKNNGTLTITNSTMKNFNNTEADIGSVIDNYGENSLFTNNTFTNNIAEFSAIVNFGANCTFSDNIFIGNNATYCGGAIYNGGKNSKFINNTFTSNKAKWGGAIYNDGENCSFTDNTFNNNIAKYGGASYNDGENCSFTDNTFNNNTAKYGGAIYNNDLGNNCIYKGNNFTSNKIQYNDSIYEMNNITINLDGGAIKNSGNNVNFTDNIFTNNAIGFDGVISKSSNVTIDFDGGAVENSGNDVNFINNKFNNDSSQINGVIYENDNITIILDGCAVENCGNNTIFTNNEFDSNLAIYDGIITKNYNLTIKINGGAIENCGNNINFTNSTFFNNLAQINNTVIKQNENATIKSYGGAISMMDSCNVNINNSNFTNNSANTNGAAIYSDTSCKVNIHNTSFNNNLVTNNTDGETLYLPGTNNVTNNSYLNNSIAFNNKTITGTTNRYNISITANITLTNPGYYDFDILNKTNYTIYFNGTNNNINKTEKGNLTYNTTLPKDKYDVHETLSIAQSTYDNYKTNTISLTVMIDTNTTIVVDSITYGETLKINGTSSNLKTGTLNITITKNGVQVASQNCTINDKTWNATFTSLDAGEYTAIVSYTNTTGDYANFRNTTTFKVNQLATNITVDNVKAVEIYDDITVKGTLVDKTGKTLADKEVTVSINDNSWTTTTDENGKYNLTTSVITPGINDIVVCYAGETNYASSKANTTVNVKQLSAITVDVLNPAVIVGNNVIITGNLTDVNTKAIANAEIVLRIDGVNYKNTTNDKGLYIYNYKTNTVKDEVKVVATFKGNDNFTSSSDNIAFEVDKMSSNIILDNIETTLVNSTVYVTGQLVNKYTSVPITNATITVKSNGVTYTGTTDNKGKYNITIKAPSMEKTVDVTVTYNGNASYDGSDESTSYDVEKYATNITVENIETIIINENITVKGTLVDETNKSLANKNIIVSINGNDNKVTTNNYGKYSYTTRATTAGINNITVSYLGDTSYASSKATTTVNVKQLSIITVDVLKPLITVGSNEVITGKLTDKNGKIIANAEIVLTIDGVNYKNTTNTKGLYTYNYKTSTVKNKVKVVATFNGNNNITSSSTNTTFNVEQLSTKITVDSVTGKVNDNITITAHITDKNNKKVNGGEVVFKVNGITLKDAKGNAIKVMVTNGVAKITTQALKTWTKEGSYITAVYGGNDVYSTSRIENAKISISLRTANIEILGFNNTTFKSGKTILFIAHVTDSGKSVQDGAVIFKINGKTIKDSKGNDIQVNVVNGIAQLKYTLPNGISAKYYNITAVYINNNYSRAETNSKLHVIKTNTHTITNNIITSTKGISKLNITVMDENNKPVKGTTKITIKMNGKTIYNQIKITNGKATFNITNPNKQGIYNITVISGESNAYNTSMTNTTLIKTVTTKSN